VAPAEPLKQYEEGKPREAWAPRTDVNDEVLWRVQLVALGDGEAEIIRVAAPGDPTVGQGEMVAVDRLPRRRGSWTAGRGWRFAARRRTSVARGARSPGHSSNNRRRTGSSGSSIEPVGDRQ
jgi:hypothetical protein